MRTDLIDLFYEKTRNPFRMDFESISLVLLIILLLLGLEDRLGPILPLPNDGDVEEEEALAGALLTVAEHPVTS